MATLKRSVSRGLVWGLLVVATVLGTIAWTYDAPRAHAAGEERELEIVAGKGSIEAFLIDHAAGKTYFLMSTDSEASWVEIGLDALGKGPLPTQGATAERVMEAVRHLQAERRERLRDAMEKAKLLLLGANREIRWF